MFLVVQDPNNWWFMCLFEVLCGVFMPIFMPIFVPMLGSTENGGMSLPLW